MSKTMKLVLSVLLIYIGLSFTHAWLNIGLDKINLFSASDTEAKFRVGFLPVT